MVQIKTNNVKRSHVCTEYWHRNLRSICYNFAIVARKWIIVSLFYGLFKYSIWFKKSIAHGKVFLLLYFIDNFIAVIESVLVCQETCHWSHYESFIVVSMALIFSLRWRHNERDGVSNHQPHDCLVNRYSGTDQRKHQGSASLAFMWGNHRDRWIPRTKGQ